MTSQLAKARLTAPAEAVLVSGRGHLKLIDGGQKRRGVRVIAYIRVSDFKHGDGLSPEVQAREIKLFCEREGLVLVGIRMLMEDGTPLTEENKYDIPVVEDLDQSGRSSRKRKIAPMIRAVDDGLADGVVVWKISRWGRNMLESLLNIKELNESGGYILSTSENLNEIDTPGGKLSLGMLLLIAQFQSDQIGEVWANIREYRLGEGVPATGGKRWGYIWNRHLDISDERYYAIDESVAQWVRRCYREYVAGRSFARLVDLLRTNRIRTPSDTEWTESSLRQTMDAGFPGGWLVHYPRDPKTGRIKRATTDTNLYLPGKHEPIIDDELWEKFKAARGIRRTAAPVKAAIHKLSGMMKCHNCDSNMTLWGTKTEGGKNGPREYRYFVCVRSITAKQRHLRSEFHCSSPARIRDITAEKKVLEEILNVATSTVDLNVTLKRQHAARAARDNSKAIKREIEALKRRRSNAYQLLLDGKIPDPSLYEEEDRRMKARIGELEIELEAAGVAERVNQIPETTVFEAIVKGWDVMSTDAINAALKQVVRHVRVTNVPHLGKRMADPRVTIRWMWDADEAAVAS